jgi:hypothetical protein
MPRKRTFWIVIAAVLALHGCSSLDPIAPGLVNTGRADFSRYLAFGNSLTAGTQSNGLVTRFQKVSYPALIATAAQAPLFEMPFISEPGIPPLLVFTSIVPTPTPEPLPGIGAPTNLNYPAIYNDLGIPGADVSELLNTRADAATSNPFFSIVLRDTLFGATATAQGVNFQPTFTTAWIGANDILGSATAGTDQLLTPVLSFEADFRAIIDALNAATTSGMAVANLPGIPTIPFFTTIPPFLVDPVTRLPIRDPTGNLIPLIGFVQGVPGPLPLNALVTLLAADSLAVGVGIPAAVGGTGRPLANFQILDPVETNNVMMRIGDFNTIIDTICANRNIPVVDIFARLNQIKADGFAFRNEVFTTDYVTGGIFSVDGIHPSSVGYYAVALEFIKVINARFGAAIPDPPFPIGPLMSRIPPAELKRFSPLEYALSLPPGALDGLLESLGVRLSNASGQRRKGISN